MAQLVLLVVLVEVVQLVVLVAQAFGEAGVVLVSQELQDVVQEFRIGVVSHV